jgi:hypothetical protein
VEKVLHEHAIPTASLRTMLNNLDIKNPQLVDGIIKVREHREGIQNRKKLSHKRKR